ncbi:MAG: hypothetical protein PWQ12_1058 [Clostridiales bacterium]|nr:hypothetical protein [Clostridiales bacterium]
MKFIKGLVLLILYIGVLGLFWVYYEQLPVDIPIQAIFSNVASGQKSDGTGEMGERTEATSETAEEETNAGDLAQGQAVEESVQNPRAHLCRTPAEEMFRNTAYAFNTDDRWLGNDTLTEVDETIGEWAQAEEDYFSDAAFIGDSRTQGFQIQSGIKQGTFLTAKGLMVDTAFTKPVVDYQGEKIPVVEALQKQKFGKVYVMLGVNELGWPYEQTFVDTYSKLIDSIQAAQPDATVYIQSIIHVSEAKSSKDAVYNNAKINRFNTLIRDLAKEKNAVYLDLNTVLSDDAGNLFADASTDGVHLNPKYCKIWYDYLKDHVWQGQF